MSNWKISLQKAIKSSEKLLEYVSVKSEGIDLNPNFPIMVPLEFADLIEKGNPEDPILKQVLATTLENIDVDGFVHDPLEESKFQPIPGLIHKYSSRVLFMLSSACAINCRYCFRRHFPYNAYRWNPQQWEKVSHYLDHHPEVNEVILSGGDPLMLRDQDIEKVMERLSQIKHIKTLRIHTRFPVVIPSRLTQDFFNTLDKWPENIVMVFHINHANEISDLFERQIEKLPKRVFKLNQSVLLKGVNDQVAVLKQLSQRLIEVGIMPYYLHQLDSVKGAHHYKVGYKEARKVYQELACQVAGYALPKWVQEEPNQPHKTLIQ